MQAMVKKPRVIVTARRPRRKTQPKAKFDPSPTPSRIIKARTQAGPDLSPEEVQRRVDASDELWRELVRRATGKEFERDC